jgi:hypothetical protein
MMHPHREQVAAAIERGKERGDVRKDLDVELAVDAVMGSFMYHTIVVGRPKRGWPERVVDNLWPAFAAKP